MAGSSVCIPRKANVEENIGCGRERSRKIGERKEKKEEKKKKRKRKERKKKKEERSRKIVLVRNKMQNWSEFLKSSFDEKLNERQHSCIRLSLPMGKSQLRCI